MTLPTGQERPTLGSTIRMRRAELGLSQETLAARVVARGDQAFRQSDVSRLERDRVQLPHRTRMECLAAALELSMGELLARAGWVGADAAFASDEVDEPEPAAMPIPAEVIWPEPGYADRPRVRPADYQRLHDAIALARATRTRTYEILRRSQELLDLYNQPLRRMAELD